MRVTGWVATNRVGSKTEFRVEIEDEDIAEMTDKEREAFIFDAVQEELYQHIEWGWKEADRA
jgi:stress-induced morphogen